MVTWIVGGNDITTGRRTETLARYDDVERLGKSVKEFLTYLGKGFTAGNSLGFILNPL
jgi:hypothetical protein